MKTSRICLLLLTSLAVLTLAVPGQAFTIIYQDNFDGPSNVDLGGQAPDIRPGAEVWQALTSSTDPVGGPFFANGDTVPGQIGGTFLPFTPTAGNIYQLSAGIDRTTTGGDWITLGFNDTLVGSSFTGAGLGTVLIRGDGFAEDGQTFNGIGTGGPNGAFDFGNDGVNDVDIILDARDGSSANWTIEYFVGGNSVLGGPVLSTANGGTGNFGDISHVGFSTNSGPGAISNFSLSIVPEPSTAAMTFGGLAMLCLLRRRRK